MNTQAHEFVAPYSRLALDYDQSLGIPAFVRIRNAFESLVRRYDVRFRSAADAGCGTGLFACYLSRRWCVPVFAVDRSTEMLEVAARNCRGANVCFLKQDLRCLSLPFPVDLITANFDTLNHLTSGGDLRLVLKRISKNLRPGGSFFFDLVTPCQPLASKRTYVRRAGTVNRTVTQCIRWDPRRRVISMNVLLRSSRSPLVVVESHRERAYWPAEVARWLSKAGLVISGVHDAMTLEPAYGCPPRITVVARKN
jgi:SAM-dependent methyltransferase